jgi:hypothetical protein
MRKIEQAFQDRRQIEVARQLLLRIVETCFAQTFAPVGQIPRCQFLILSILSLAAGLLSSYIGINYDQGIGKTEDVYNGMVPDEHGFDRPSFTYTVDGVTYNLISNYNILLIAPAVSLVA